MNAAGARGPRRVRALAPSTALIVILTSAPAAAQTFLDMGPLLGLGGSYAGQGAFIGGGVSLVDLDADGDLDLIHTPVTGPPTLYWRTDTGAFLEDPLSLQPSTSPGTALGHVPLDADRDGDLDVLLLRDGALALLMNQGSGPFRDESNTRLPWLARATRSGAAGDFDADGDVDIYVGSYALVYSFPRHTCGQNVLLENDGTGHFVDRAVEYGVADDGCTLATAMSDLDGDGDLDLISINDFGMFDHGNRLYRNDGPTASGWAFRDVTAEWGAPGGVYGMGVAIDDLDGDGRLDLLVSSIGRMSALANRAGAHGPELVDIGDETGLGVTYARDGAQVTWGSVFEDFDLDGQLDAVAAGGHIPSAGYIDNASDVTTVVWRGLGGGVFQVDPVGAVLAEQPGHMARGLSRGDVDGDGRPDFALAHAGSLLSLYLNTSPGAPGLVVRLVPRYTGSAVGARVTATCAGVTRMRELQTGGTFAGAHDPAVFMTFPPPCTAAGSEVVYAVRFPSGYTVAGASETAASIVVEEPEWIVREPNALRAAPTDATGAPVSPGRVGFLGGDLGATTESDGWAFTALGAPEPGTWARITVDGVALPVTLRLAPPAPTVRASPPIPTAGRPIRWVFRSSEPVAQVLVDSVEVPFAQESDGWWSAAQTDAGAVGAREIRVIGASGTLLEAAFPVQPYVSVDRSDVTTRDMAVVGVSTSPARVFVAPCDENQRCGAVASDVTVSRNGDPVAVGLSEDGARVAATFAAGTLVDGDMVAVTVRGIPLDSVVYRAFATASDLAAVVDPTRSRCDAGLETARADGQDVVTFVVDLRASDGSRLPITGVDGVGSGVTFIEGSLATSTLFSSVLARAGLVPGPAELGLRIQGVDLGVTCRVTLLPPLPAAVDPTRSTLTATQSALLVATGDAGYVRITVVPRGPTGRLLGSGHAVALTTTLGTIVPAVYRGAGYYDATLTSDGAFGTAVVTGSIDGVPLTGEALVTFIEKVPPPVDEDGADADASGPDSAVEDAVDLAETLTAEPTPDEAQPDLDDAADTAPEYEPDEEVAVEHPLDAADPVEANSLDTAGDVAVDVAPLDETFDAEIDADDRAPESCSRAPESCSRAPESGDRVDGADVVAPSDAAGAGLVPADATTGGTHVGDGGCGVGGSSCAPGTLLLLLVAVGWSRRRRGQGHPSAQTNTASSLPGCAAP